VLDRCFLEKWRCSIREFRFTASDAWMVVVYAPINSVVPMASRAIRMGEWTSAPDKIKAIRLGRRFRESAGVEMRATRAVFVD